MRKIFLTGAVCTLLLGSAGCTEPGEATAIGAATGGAIGAGLGAIIGSQTGDPGAGLVLGAAAGAGTGALVANSFEAQQEQLRNQDEAIARQERTIAAQRRELDELRRMSDVPSDRAVTMAPAFHGRAPSAHSPATGLSQHDVREKVLSPEAIRRESGVFERSRSAELAAGKMQQPGPSSFAQSPGEAKGTLNWSASPQEVLAPTRSAESELSESVARPDEQPLQATSVVKAEPVSGECSEAQAEVRKADNASEAPDKLFHLRRALRLCPSEPGYHNALGEVYLGLNRKVDAEFEFREAIQLDPNFEAARRNLEGLSAGVQRNNY